MILTGGWAAALLACTHFRQDALRPILLDYHSIDFTRRRGRRLHNEGETDRIILQKSFPTHHIREGLRLNNLLQCNPAANDQRRTFQHHQLLLLELRE